MRPFLPLLIVSAACLFAAPAGAARDTALPDGPYISTSADAEAEMSPDFAVLDLNVRVVEESPEAARQAINIAQQRLLKVLSGFDDALRDHRILRLSFGENREYDRESQRQVRTGYFGRFSYQVRVGDLDQLNALHYQLAELEMESLEGPRFELTPENQQLLEQRARQQAVRAATLRAEQLAEAQGAALGLIWGIIYQPMHELAGGAGGGNEGRDPRLAMTSRDAEFVIAFEPQPIRFQTRVGVVYRLIPAQPD